MLRSFWTHQYRNLHVPTPPRFGRCNLLIGPNNSGKSNFMKAMGFLRDMLLCDSESPSASVASGFGSHAYFSSQTAFLQTAAAHGREDVLHRAQRAKGLKGRVPQEVQFDWLLESSGSSGSEGSAATPIPPSDLLYRIGYAIGETGSFPEGCYLRHEVLSREARRDLRGIPLPSDLSLFSAVCQLPPSLTARGRFQVRSTGSPPSPVELAVEPTETVLHQTKALLKNKEFYEKIYPEFDRVSEELLAFARGFRSYTSTDLDVRRLAEGAKIDLGVRQLGRDGGDFVNVLRYLDQKYDFLDEYKRRLQELLPDLSRIKVIDASDTHKQFELHIGGHKYKPSEMSDGTLKALWLALLLFSPDRGSLLSIDEPELNFHPAWLRVIGGWLQRFSSAEQLFVSTHSPDLLDSFTEGFKTGEVVLFVFGKGEAPLQQVEPATLDGFFQDGWELGDLYRVGEPKLGGWPW